MIKSTYLILLIVLSGSNLLAQNTLNYQFTEPTETPFSENISNYEQFYVPVTLTALNDLTAVNNDKQIPEKPPLSAIRIGGEILGGMTLGVGMAYLLASTSVDIYEAVGLAWLGYIGGNAMGVYIIGNIGNERGSLFATTLGSIFGSIIGAYAGVPLNESILGIVPLLLGTPIFSTILFNKSRRYDSNYLNSGLTNLDLSKNNMELGFPNIYLIKLPQSNLKSINVELINVTF